MCDEKYKCMSTTCNYRWGNTSGGRTCGSATYCTIRVKPVATPLEPVATPLEPVCEFKYKEKVLYRGKEVLFLGTPAGRYGNYSYLYVEKDGSRYCEPMFGGKEDFSKLPKVCKCCGQEIKSS